MLKSILKEILFTIISIAVILLILAIVLYDYNPIVKNIPESVKYEISKEVSDELNSQAIPNDTRVIVTYEVDNADLNNAQDYNPGKKNPFIKYKTEDVDGSPINGGTTSSGSSNGSSNNSTNSSTNGSSGSNNSGYFQNSSTK